MLTIVGAIFITWFIIQILSIPWALKSHIDEQKKQKQHEKACDKFREDYNHYKASLSPEKEIETERILDSYSEMTQWRRDAVYADINNWVRLNPKQEGL